MDLRVRLAVEQGGPFNYREKMDVVARRINLNFNEAIARLTAARVGLESIFGFKHPLPESVKQFFPGDDTSSKSASGVLDDCVEWVRQAIAWLVRFTAFDQSCIITVSVKQHITEDQWKLGLQGGG